MVSPLSIGFSTMCAASAAYSAGWPSRAGCGTCAPIDLICSSDRPPSSGVWNRPGAIAVGGQVEVGQTVRFHVRDAASADEDLRRTLEREALALAGRPPAGALLFTCTGRGARMFGAPDHDTGLLAQALGQLPVAGFFCDGELGPVGGQNFLHTFTASIALFPSAAG